MVTKRARTWLARGTLITVLAIISTLGIGTWALSGGVASELLLPSDPDSLVTVIAVDARSVTITADTRTVLPGVWGLATDHGAATLGDVVVADATSVRRALLDRSGVITVGAAAAFQRIVYRPDPEAVGVPFTEVILEGPIGEVSAWTTTGTDDTWVVFIHDFGVDGTEALRVIEFFADLGLPVIVPALRTDVAVAEGGRRTADLGSAGWRDLIPALDFAIASGAEDIVLFGSGTGASSALLAATDPRYSAHIAALVLDGPLLDPADVADRHLAHAQELASGLRAAGLRPHVDESAETVGKKVRAAQLMKVPYTLVIGDKEIDSGALTVRRRDGVETKGVSLEAFTAALALEADTRSLEPSTFEG